MWLRYLLNRLRPDSPPLRGYPPHPPRLRPLDCLRYRDCLRLLHCRCYRAIQTRPDYPKHLRSPHYRTRRLRLQDLEIQSRH
jgi:hypothetical protein